MDDANKLDLNYTNMVKSALVYVLAAPVIAMFGYLILLKAGSLSPVLARYVSEPFEQLAGWDILGLFLDFFKYLYAPAMFAGVLASVARVNGKTGFGFALLSSLACLVLYLPVLMARLGVQTSGDLIAVSIISAFACLCCWYLSQRFWPAVQ